MQEIFLAVCLLFSLRQDSQNETLPKSFQARVIAVKDGDTIQVLVNGKPMTIRLAHIDCPEVKKGQPFGKAAKQFTSDRCFAQAVTILHANRFDRYHRLIAVVFNNKGINVNKALVAAGLAWHFKKYSSDQTYAALEQTARSRQVGLWRDKNPVPPWHWRYRK